MKARKISQGASDGVIGRGFLREGIEFLHKADAGMEIEERPTWLVISIEDAETVRACPVVGWEIGLGETVSVSEVERWWEPLDWDDPRYQQG